MTASVIFWVDEFYPHVGGLERRVKALADRISNRAKVAVVTHSPPGPGDDLGYPVIVVPPPDDLHAAEQHVRRLITEVSCLYVCRLLPGREVEHAKVIAGLAGETAILLRAQSTRAAHLLVRSDVRETLDGRLAAIHALNVTSFDLLARRYTRTRIDLTPNSLDPAALPELRRSGPIVSAGRIVPEKRTAEVVRAWRKVREVRDVPPLHVYGRIVDQRYFASCERAMSGSSASYRGEYSFSDWQPLRSASAVVIASEREGHSNLATEAMMHGAVLVARAIPGLEEHVRDGRGVLAPPDGGVDEIAAALHALLDLTDGAFLSMRNAAHAYAQDLARRDLQLEAILRQLGLDYGV